MTSDESVPLNRRVWHLCVSAVLLSLGFAHSAAGQPTSNQVEFFERRIRPFLASECYECHGAKKQEGGLRVDSRDGLLEGGDSGPALVAGDSAKSLLIELITDKDPDSRMPMERPKLPDTVIANFVKWVNDGAPDPRDQPPAADAASSADWQNVFDARKDWWSLKPPRKPALPAVANNNWSRHPVDRFILARLEQHGLQPAAAASPRAWLRRVNFAITGLPPTPEEVQTFLNDKSSDARARVVDRLLDSPHFGERWARHWMDLVRFAESYGHEQDFDIPHAWQYRDYLIRAFNADVPYGQFVREHIAGDLLENPRRHPTRGFNESVIGTGFWYLHQATHGPVDPLQDEADRIDNQIDVMSKTFLGLTVACARCHDHKFDAISTKDYYSLTAFLRGSRQDITYLDPDGSLERQTANLRKHHATATRQLQSALKNVRDAGGPKVAPYLLAAREVIHGPAKPADAKKNPTPDIVFEDFEDGTYARWKVEGDAFGTEPAAGKHPNQQPVEGFHGKRLVNSFTQGDPPMGILRSRPFRIERPYIRFLVGGGTPTRKAKVVLQIADREVREATGKNRELLEPRVWDVREFMGREAAIEIIDRTDSTWGHINVDDIVFTQSPVKGRVARSVAIVAAEHGLNRLFLERWVHELLAPETRQPSHPLQPWLAAAARSTQSLPAREAPTRPGDVEFPAGDFNKWFASGQAFPPRIGHVGKWRIEGDQVGLLPPNVAHSGLLADGLQGVLRSPTFTLTHKNLHLRMAGNSGQIRLIIARYGLREFNPLLFTETLFDVNTNGQFVWHSLTKDIRRHTGRQAYLELVDNGDGYVALDRVVFSTSDKPPVDPPALPPRTTSETPADYARRIDAAARRAVGSWINNDGHVESFPLLSWMSNKGLLDWGDASLEIPQLAERIRQASAGLSKPMRVLAMTDGSVEETRVFIRGNHNTPGEAVPRRFLEAVAGPSPAAIAEGSGRKELAEAMVAGNNPWLHRVLVNRVWHHLFGRGLVPSVDNLGALGESPTHPELLDYLAATFRDSGGSMKQLIRSLCLTQTYQLSSALDDPVAEARDPANALLHRQRVRRLEGEAMRDSLLAVAGQLDPTPFGPSVPTYFSPFMSEPMWLTQRGITSGPMDGNRRRSIYLETRRNVLSPLMLAFDLAVPDSTVGRRHLSNVPRQSLVLMNDPFVKQQAEHWAREYVRQADTPIPSRIEDMYLRALARPPNPDEADRMLSFVASQAGGYGLSGDEVLSSQRLWADVCHVVFMLKEFIYVP